MNGKDYSQRQLRVEADESVYQPNPNVANTSSQTSDANLNLSNAASSSQAENEVAVEELSEQRTRSNLTRRQEAMLSNTGDRSYYASANRYHPRMGSDGRVAQACVRCRSSKIKCDSQRPCARCQSQGCPELCEYTETRQRGRKRGNDDERDQKRRKNVSTAAQPKAPRSKKAARDSAYAFDDAAVMHGDSASHGLVKLGHTGRNASHQSQFSVISHLHPNIQASPPQQSFYQQPSQLAAPQQPQRTHSTAQNVYLFADHAYLPANAAQSAPALGQHLSAVPNGNVQANVSAVVFATQQTLSTFPNGGAQPPQAPAGSARGIAGMGSLLHLPPTAYTRPASTIAGVGMLPAATGAPLSGTGVGANASLAFRPPPAHAQPPKNAHLGAFGGISAPFYANSLSPPATTTTLGKAAAGVSRLWGSMRNMLPTTPGFLPSVMTTGTRNNVPSVSAFARTAAVPTALNMALTAHGNSQLRHATDTSTSAASSCTPLPAPFPLSPAPLLGSASGSSAGLSANFPPQLPAAPRTSVRDVQSGYTSSLTGTLSDAPTPAPTSSATPPPFLSSSPGVKTPAALGNVFPSFAATPFHTPAPVQGVPTTDHVRAALPTIAPVSADAALAVAPSRAQVAPSSPASAAPSTQQLQQLAQALLPVLGDSSHASMSDLVALLRNPAALQAVVAQVSAAPAESDARHTLQGLLSLVEAALAQRKTAPTQAASASTDPSLLALPPVSTPPQHATPASATPLSPPTAPVAAPTEYQLTTPPVPTTTAVVESAAPVVAQPVSVLPTPGSKCPAAASSAELAEQGECTPVEFDPPALPRPLMGMLRQLVSNVATMAPNGAQEPTQAQAADYARAHVQLKTTAARSPNIRAAAPCRTTTCAFPSSSFSAMSLSSAAEIAAKLAQAHAAFAPILVPRCQCEAGKPLCAMCGVIAPAPTPGILPLADTFPLFAHLLTAMQPNSNITITFIIFYIGELLARFATRLVAIADSDSSLLRRVVSVIQQTDIFCISMVRDYRLHAHPRFGAPVELLHNLSILRPIPAARKRDAAGKPVSTVLEAALDPGSEYYVVDEQGRISAAAPPRVHPATVDSMSMVYVLAAGGTLASHERTAQMSPALAVTLDAHEELETVHGKMWDMVDLARRIPHMVEPGVACFAMPMQPAGYPLFVNEEFAAMLGYATDELHAKLQSLRGLVQVATPAVLESVLCMLQAGLVEAPCLFRRHMWLHKDGYPVYTLDTVSLVFPRNTGYFPACVYLRCRIDPNPCAPASHFLPICPIGLRLNVLRTLSPISLGTAVTLAVAGLPSRAAAHVPRRNAVFSRAAGTDSCCGSGAKSGAGVSAQHAHSSVVDAEHVSGLLCGSDHTTRVHEHLHNIGLFSLQCCPSCDYANCKIGKCPPSCSCGHMRDILRDCAAQLDECVPRLVQEKLPSLLQRAQGYSEECSVLRESLFANSPLSTLEGLTAAQVATEAGTAEEALAAALAAAFGSTSPVSPVQPTSTHSSAGSMQPTADLAHEPPVAPSASALAAANGLSFMACVQQRAEELTRPTDLYSRVASAICDCELRHEALKAVAFLPLTIAHTLPMPLAARRVRSASDTSTTAPSSCCALKEAATDASAKDEVLGDASLFAVVADPVRCGEWEYVFESHVTATKASSDALAGASEDSGSSDGEDCEDAATSPPNEPASSSLAVSAPLGDNATAVDSSEPSLAARVLSPVKCAAKLLLSPLESLLSLAQASSQTLPPSFSSVLQLPSEASLCLLHIMQQYPELAAMLLSHPTLLSVVIPRPHLLFLIAESATLAADIATLCKAFPALIGVITGHPTLLEPLLTHPTLMSYLATHQHVVKAALENSRIIPTIVLSPACLQLLTEDVSLIEPLVAAPLLLQDADAACAALRTSAGLNAP